mgnify:CR=1 FL=1
MTVSRATANKYAHTPQGIYERGAGLDTVLMSWGHDEYLYYVTKDFLPEPAQYMWTLRLFRTRPCGRAKLYKQRKTPPASG